MKTKLLILTCLLSQFFYGQNIVIPDPVFKSFLLNASINFDPNPITNFSYPPIDSNNDGEISQAEALQVVGLDLYYFDITNLEGLQFFTNLKVLNSFYSNFSVFDFPTLVNLEELTLNNSVSSGSLTTVNLTSNVNLKRFVSSSSLITSLDFSNNVNLEKISIFCPNLTSVNFSNLENLRELDYYGKLPTIDLSDCVNLLNLACAGSSASFLVPEENKLTALDLSNQSRLVNLSVAGNNLMSLDLSFCPNLENITISMNKISNLNLDNLAYVKNLYCDNNLLTSLNMDAFFNLQSFYCNNNLLTSLSTKNRIIEDYYSFDGNPDLETICSDENEVVYYKNQALLYGYDTVIVSSVCGQESRTAVAMRPNPVVDKLHLDTDGVVSKVEVFGVSSLLVMNDESGSKTLDMSTLEAGIYFVKVYVGNEVTTMKLVKS